MRPLPLLAAVALLTGCASVPGDAEGQLAGCYQFRYDQGARALGLPWGVVLHDEPLPGVWPLVESLPDVMLAETATSATARADHPFGYWRPLAGDSLEIGHPGGGGFTLTLAVQGEDLVGRGQPVGDVVRPGEPGGPRPPQPVVARRVLCGAS